MIELKPCPFCGSAAKFRERSNAYGSGASGMEAPDLHVICADPNCVVRPETPGSPVQVFVRNQGYVDVRTNVEMDQARRWNTRT